LCCLWVSSNIESSSFDFWSLGGFLILQL
jgi:hypothetical protein